MKDLTKLYKDIVELYESVINESEEDYAQWELSNEWEAFVASARNLFAYMAVRRRDLQSLQERLSQQGLSSLGRMESRTLYNLERIIALLAKVTGQTEELAEIELDSFAEGHKRLRENTELIFGSSERDRLSQIMVTMPQEASENEDYVRRLVKEGMDIARINCAHDSPEVWEQMIKNIRQAAEAKGQNVQVMMDLAGPKIRTEWIFTTYKKPKVERGDLVRMTSRTDQVPPVDDEIKVTMGCSIEDVYRQIATGDQVLLDDGSVEFTVHEVGDKEAILKVEQVKGGNLRIKAEKGLNFPDTDFGIAILDEEDEKALAFALEHDAIVGMSFVRTATDIKELQAAIQKYTDRPLAEIPLLVKVDPSLVAAEPCWRNCPWMLANSSSSSMGLVM